MSEREGLKESALGPGRCVEIDGQSIRSVGESGQILPLAWKFLSSPNGIRTRVATLRGWCPRPLDDGTRRRNPEGFRRARGEGLEPSITGPEPVVLPITPPPIEWIFRLAERPGGTDPSPDQEGARASGFSPMGRFVLPEDPGRVGHGGRRMYRWRAAAVGVSCVGLPAAAAL